ncbi:MAG: hypothetical protein IJU23_02640 [Proteobacteria bacterium]|nr:hypothetical protein [Pseudomonadota bacterium]
MKSKALFLLITPLCILSGCVLGDPVEYGEACPGLDKAGTLNYIENRQTCSAEHAFQCTFEDQIDENNNKIEFDFSLYFNKRYCPPQYPKCKTDTVKDEETKQDFTFYHCEKDTRTQIECASEQKKCPIKSDNADVSSETGEFECIDPASSNTCGASSCDAENNYGGVNCFLYNMFSTCQKNQDGNYVCMCASGALQCNGECIDPASKITCGAYDCSLENYGGKDCTEYQDKRICVQDAETKKYDCVCQDGDILCGDKCITPGTSVEHCGAKGLCNDPDLESDNFEGTDCGSSGICDNGVCKCEGGEGILCGDKCVLPQTDGEHCGAKGSCNDPDSGSDNYQGIACGAGGFCHNGKCECYDGIWCINKEGTGQCVKPTDRETCNARLAADKLHCDYTECKETEVCVPDTDSAYRCDATSCDETTENLCIINFRNTCVSKSDVNHCNTCNKDCAAHTFANIKSYSCTEKDGTPTCSYVCTDTTINCGTEINPKCVNTHTDAKNCGGCGNVCGSGKFCDDGTCQETDCPSNQCTIKETEIACVNVDQLCGGNCVSCKSLHANGFCDNGSCYIESCNAGEHPVYDGAGRITQCVKNSVTSCAPSSLTSEQSATNCNTWKPENAANVECDTNAGACYIVSCNNGYHLAPDKQSCEINTSTSCGANNSTQTTSCSELQNTCNNGKCECPGGKKLNFDGNNCVIPACSGIPGVYEGTLLAKSWWNNTVDDYACNPTQCNEGYKRESQNGKNKFFSCRPKIELGCTSLGYKYSADGYCIGRQDGTGLNSHVQCADSYRQYILACLHKDVCCGTRNENMTNSLDYVCRNCAAQGKTCNMTSGECE